MLWQSLTWFTLPEGFALNIREWYRMITNDVALETPLSLVRLKVFLNLGTNADGKICHSLATPCANMMVNSERTSSIDYCNYSHLHLWHFMCLFMLFIYTYIYLFMIIYARMIPAYSAHILPFQNLIQPLQLRDLTHFWLGEWSEDNHLRTSWKLVVVDFSVPQMWVPQKGTHFRLLLEQCS